MIYKVKVFGVVNEAKIDVFLELSCFFDDPADVGNLISGSSAFSQSSLGFSRVTAGFSSYDGEFRMPLVLAEASPIFHSSCEGKLGIALE